MGKSPDAFRTISEAAGELDLPQHVLRFWETRFTQIKPLKRGGGRRYYRPDDVLLLKGIRHLLYDQGFTIRGVQRILREEGPRYAISIGEAGSIEALNLADSGTPAAPVQAQIKVPQSVETEIEAPPTASATANNIPKNQVTARISSQGRQKLTQVMLELLECKRLLDHAREG